MSKRLRPKFDFVLLKREPLKSKSLIITQSAAVRNSPHIGLVISKGKGADAEIEVGTWVLFGIHAGTWIRADGRPALDDDVEAFYIVKDVDILCDIVEE